MSKSDLDGLQKALLALRDAGKTSHQECDDFWYSCPKSGGDYNTLQYTQDECICGADLHNSAIEAAYEAARAIVDDMLVIDALTQKRVLRRKE